MQGAHGFDPALPQMDGIFLARGASFRHAPPASRVRNVDIYLLVCTLLGLAPSANNGSLQNVLATLGRGFDAGAFPTGT